MTSTTKQRILFITQEFTLGGAAYLALRHVKRLIDRYEIDLLVVGFSDQSMLELLPLNVSIYRLEIIVNQPLMDGFECLEILQDYLSMPPFQLQYQAVIATSIFPRWTSCVATSLVNSANKIVFLVDEGLGDFSSLSAGEQTAIECCVLDVKQIVSVSFRLWQKMSDCCPLLKNIPYHIMRPPIETDISEKTSAEIKTSLGFSIKPIVLTVARLSPDKQIIKCLHIHKKLAMKAIDFHWYVIGGGPEEETIRAEIKRLNMSECFFLLGPLDNSSVFSWMKQCDIFALISAHEGCPTVVLEALMLGCPVIMTNVNGAEELIDNGHTGIIVANDEDDITAGMLRLITEPELRTKFRHNITLNPPVVDEKTDTDWLIKQIDAQIDHNIKPKVTILIPTYNQERFIHRAIASALMQDFYALEVIVVDDNSTDQTSVLANLWQNNPRFQYKRNSRNLGRVANYHKALTEYASGEWVLVLDGDDYLTDPCFISEAWSACQRYSNRPIVFAQAGHRVYYEQPNHQHVDILPSFIESERIFTGGEYLNFVFETGFFTHLGAFYKRQLAIDLDFYTLDISSSDMDGLLRLALEGEVLILNTLAGCWVQHDDNASSNLALNDIAANVRLFRQITRMAAKRNIVSMDSINPVLSQYEAHTLAHLFGQSFEKNWYGPRAILKMIIIIISVNPSLLLNRRVLKSFWMNILILARHSIKARVICRIIYAVISKISGWLK
jgi:glycosyltransferase involved in cell wall biosynthesis